MTDMRRGGLMQDENGEHSVCKLRVRVAHCPPPPVARKLSYPSWKVIVSASHGRYLKPGPNEPGFFSRHPFIRCHPEEPRSSVAYRRTGDFVCGSRFEARRKFASKIRMTAVYE